MAAVAVVLACVQASAMAIANAACCCRMPMPADCAMHSASAMPAQHHHDMSGMTMADMPSSPAAQSDDTTCHFACLPQLSSSLFVTPGVAPVAPVAVAVAFVLAPAPPSPVLFPIDLARVPHAPPPRA